MSKEQLMAYMAAILTALRDVGHDAAESTLYLAVGMDIELWHKLRAVLVGAGLVTVSGYRVALTPKGEATADKCNAVIAAS